MDISLILDITISVLLVVTIIYCAVLMRKLSNLRSAQGELRQIINGFGEAISKAETSTIELRKAGAEAAQALDERIDVRRRDLESQISKATELANDLEFMSDAGNKLADRLEVAISDARLAEAQTVKTQEAAALSSPRSGVAITSSVPAVGPLDGEAAATATARPAAALDTGGDTWQDIEEGEDDPDLHDELGARSEVERDLLQALRQSK